MPRFLLRQVKHAPTPMAGLALGIASLGLCWEGAIGGRFFSLGAVTFDGELIRQITAFVAASLVITLLVKFLRHPQLLKDDLAHPVVGSVVPTMAMASMVLSVTLADWFPLLGQAVWLAAVLAHISFLAVFCYHRSREFQLHHMVPSWFVPPIGMIVAAVTFPGGQLDWVASMTLYFGIAAYAVLLPAMLFRLLFDKPVPEQAKPTLAILAAPASLSLAGYLSFVEQPSMWLVALLSVVAVTMTSLVYLLLLRLIRLPFTPGYAAFTFPLVIGATALYKLAEWLCQSGVADHYRDRVILLANIELAVATVMVVYVSYRYLSHYQWVPQRDL
ncbi:TDT family transporter [Thaumasiovibrio subtropicus]|uniref:TDT family transporter n=1 Tax=Thaumasiovibrio subtropicus TaxID=1891207 RepID=UPI000B359BBF|nr:TDT family transporter [Thaumasiovibrio subtropicus]